MSYEIYDNGASIKFVSGDEVFLLMKNAIKKISVIRRNYVKIEKKNCLESILFNYKDVFVPVTVSATALMNVINNWMIAIIQPPPND
jgi:hypothetical protein